MCAWSDKVRYSGSDMQQDSIPAQPVVATTSESGSPRKPSKWQSFKGVASTVAILVAAPIVALALTAFVFQSYEVDGPSMETTLQNSDRLIVWKLPKTWSRITGHEYVPNRGDVIIFVKHDLFEAGSSSEKQLIKRVVGLPGDRVVIKNGHITVYNSERPSGFNPDIGHTIASPTIGNVDLVIPEGQVYVCGDNRPDSLDSRAFGTVSVKDIVGKLEYRIFPISKFQSF